MTRSVSVSVGLAGVLLLSLLTASGAPAQATNVSMATDGLVVGSQHDSATEFQNAQELANLTVEGSGDAASVTLTEGPTIIDDFEDGDVAEYEGSTANLAAQTDVVNHGSYAAEFSGTGSFEQFWATADTGLPQNVSQGDTFSYRMRYGQDENFVTGLFATQGTSQMWYAVAINDDTNELLFRKDTRGSGGSLTTLDSTAVDDLDNDTWYRVTVDWKTDGSFTITVTNTATGTDVGTLSATDTTFIEGGIGGAADNTNGQFYWDYYTTGTSASSAQYVSDTHAVSNAEQAAINITQLSNATVSPAIRYLYDNGSVAYHAGKVDITSTGNHTYNLSDQADKYDKIQIELNVDVDGENPQFTLADESTLFDNHAPSASDPTPRNTSVDDATVELSATVNDTEFSTVQGESVDVDFVLDGSVVDSTTISSNQTVSTTVDGLEDGSHSWHLELSDSYGASTTTSSWSFDVNHYAPAIDNATASPENKTVNSSTFDLSVDVSDRDFADQNGDEVNVSFYIDGEYRGSDVGTANRTYDITITNITGGSHNWTAVATSTKPSNESTTSEAFPFSYPSDLEIRNETGNHEILNVTTEVEVTFYTDDKIVTKTATDGVVSMTGLPVDEEFVVTIEADGWYSRRIIIDSLTSQNTVYLLNESETAVYNEFELHDLTGNYPRESTRLYVKRGMNVSGSSGYYTIAGDYLGATGSFPVHLLKGARYKIVLETKDGRRTTVGAYLAESEGLKTVRVGTVEFEYPEDDSYHAVAIQDNNTLHWKFSDPQQKTQDLSLQIYEQGNKSNVIYEDTINELGNYTLSVDLTTVDVKNATEKQWSIKWSATRDGAEIGATSPFAPIPEFPIPLGGVWKAGLSFIMVLFVAALGGGQYSPEGAIATVAIAGVLMGAGFADIYGFAWWVAFVIAVGGYLYERGVPI